MRRSLRGLRCWGRVFFLKRPKLSSRRSHRLFLAQSPFDERVLGNRSACLSKRVGGGFGEDQGAACETGFSQYGDLRSNYLTYLYSRPLVLATSAFIPILVCHRQPLAVGFGFQGEVVNLSSFAHFITGRLVMPGAIGVAKPYLLV